MLPASTGERTQRAVSRGRPDGRTVEIQRLIGRALRSVCDFEALGERTLWLDCDVLQADGGTRCASITGAWIAARRALDRFGLSKALPGSIAAVSVGIVDGEAVLDLDYEEDSSAETDMNVVMTGDGTPRRGAGDRRARPLLARAARRAARSRGRRDRGAHGRAGARPPATPAAPREAAPRVANENKLRELRGRAPGLGDRAPRDARRAGRGRRDVPRQRADQGPARPHCTLPPTPGSPARTPASRSPRSVDGPASQSARWAEDGVARLLVELDGQADRRARYVCELVVLAPDGTEVRATGTLEGAIADGREATRASATTRSSSRTARRAPSPSSATRGRPSTRTARRPRTRSRTRSRSLNAGSVGRHGCGPGARRAHGALVPDHRGGRARRRTAPCSPRRPRTRRGRRRSARRSSSSAAAAELGDRRARRDARRGRARRGRALRRPRGRAHRRRDDGPEADVRARRLRPPNVRAGDRRRRSRRSGGARKPKEEAE